MTREHVIQQEILARLGALPGLTVWRNNSGALVDQRGQLVRYGQPGSADVLGVASPSGRLIAIEVKAARGKLSERQQAWGAMIQRHGGVYIIARSVEEALGGLRDHGVEV